MKNFIDDLIQDKTARIHFVGIGGTGVSALADFRLLQGGAVSGSDRSYDQGVALSQRDHFISRGAQIFPQDGSGVAGAAAIVASAAVEDDVPDMAAARALGILVIRRTQWIAAYTRAYRTIAVTGTAGKSTGAAMIFEILRAGGLDPSLITGADLRMLLASDLPGSAYLGAGPLVIEADESDRGIMEYDPKTTVVLNLGRDHDTPERILEIFRALTDKSEHVVLLDDPGLMPLYALGRLVCGPAAPDSSYQVTRIEEGADRISFYYGGTHVRLPVPGVHNVLNAAAAMTTGRIYGLDSAQMVGALEKFQGVARRLEVVGSNAHIDVIDDYAANTMKIEAAIRAVQRRRPQVIAYMQPVGFGPMRLMRSELCPMLARVMRPQDTLILSPIPYFGGTVARDISSDDLVADIRAAGATAPAHVIPTRQDFIAWARDQNFQDTAILIMGARDPTLSVFAREVAQAVL